MIPYLVKYSILADNKLPISGLPNFRDHAAKFFKTSQLFYAVNDIRNKHFRFLGIVESNKIAGIFEVFERPGRPDDFLHTRQDFILFKASA